MQPLAFFLQFATATGRSQQLDQFFLSSD